MFVIQGYYAILDLKGSSQALPETLRHASALLAAKPCFLQLRGKQLGLATMCELGHALRSLCDEHDVPLCINDRLDVALAVGADGVHLGQRDFPLAEAVRLKKAIGRTGLRIGMSTSNLDEARAAVDGGADHIGFGPIFPTQSKADARPPIGVAELAEVCSAVDVPVVAIGGITLDNVADVVSAGASAAAVIGAVDLADNPTRAGQAIARAFRRDSEARLSPRART
jgi:thiamine-phosphate diphosphorylase